MNFRRIDSSVFVNLKLLEQRPEPPAVASYDVPMFCNNINLENIEQMDQMTQRVRTIDCWTNFRMEFLDRLLRVLMVFDM